MKLIMQNGQRRLLGCRYTLPEMRPLPSVQGFAECKLSGTRQRASLPSAALSKGKHTVNFSFAECLVEEFFA
jgi:hypothetical protein